MAKDKLLYDDIIDKSVKEGIDTLKKSMNELYESFKKLTEQSVKNSTSTKDAASSTKKLSSEQRRINEEEKKAEKIARDLKNAREKLTIEYQRQQRQQREALRTAKLKEIADNKELGTVQRLTAANQLLIDKRNRLNLETEKGRKKAEQYNKQIDKNTQIIKTNSSAVEQQRMNIGNYQSALTGLPGPLGAASSGIFRMTQMAKAFIGTPLGLILGGVALAVGAVVGAFKLLATTDTGATEMAAYWGGFKAKMDEFRRSLLDGDWKRAWNLASGGASASRDATMEYVRAMDMLNDRIALQKANIELLNTEIEREKVLSKDMMLSSEDRLKHAEKAYARRGELLELERKNVEDNYNLEVKRLAKVSEVSEDVLKQYAFATEEEQKLLVQNNERLAAFRENSESELFKLVEVAAQKQKVETDYHRESRRLVTELSNTKKQALNDEINDMKLAYERKLSILKAERNYMNDDFYYNLKQDRKQFEAEIERDRKVLQESATLLSIDEFNVRYNNIEQREKQFYADELKRKKTHEDNLRKQKELSNIKTLELERDFRLSELRVMGVGHSAMFSAEERYNEEILQLRKNYGLITEIEYNTHLNNMAVARKQQQQKELEETQAMFNEMNLSLPENESANEDFSFFESPVTFKERFNEYKDVYKEAGQSVVDITREHYEEMREIADLEKQLADDKVSNARDYFNQQQNLAAQGFQNNMAQAEKELLLAKQTQAKAEREQRKALRNQQILQSLEQGANLLTASTSIFQTSGGNPLIYLPLLATMWGSFFVQKAKSLTATRYGKGGMFDVGGGSHASGNDTSLGVHGGRERIVEGGEKVFIVNKTSSKKYRNMLPNLVDSINKGNLSVKADSRGNIVNISTEKMERGLDRIAKNTSTITYSKNGKTIIKQGLNTIEYV